jgi:hypothetical protein
MITTIFTELTRLLKTYPEKKITVYLDQRIRDKSIKNINKLIERNPSVTLKYVVLKPWNDTFDKSYSKPNGEEIEVVLRYV